MRIFYYSVFTCNIIPAALDKLSSVLLTWPSSGISDDYLFGLLSAGMQKLNCQSLAFVHLNHSLLIKIKLPNPRKNENGGQAALSSV